MTFNAGALKEKIKKAGLKPPKTLTLMITDACNLTCPHCLLDCNGPEGVLVSGDIITTIIDDFSKLGGETLHITGGEPLLHPDWYEILSHASKSSGLSEVVVQTNGAIVTPQDIKKIKLLPDKIRIQISLDGATPGTNDMIRGNGNFEAAISAIKLFIKEGIGKRVHIAFTEMKHNFNEIPEMLKFADNLGAGKFIAGTLIKAGRAKHADWIRLPDKSQLKSLIERYEAEPEFRKLYDRIGSISAIEWYKGRDVPTDHVCNCISTPYISASGKMYPCVMNIDDNLAEENVHNEGLYIVILKGLVKWSRLPLLDMERSELLVKCRNCAGREHCRGGCLGRAFTVNGDVMTVEDRCELRREVYYFE